MTAMLSENAVHLVWFDLDARKEVAELTVLLDEHERSRAARFRFDTIRDRFIITHALTRITLGHLLGVDAGSVRFSNSAHGKPRIDEPGIDVRFNVSQSAGRALLAVALGREIGVDLEEERPIEVLELAQRYFSPREYAAVARLSSEQHEPAFFRCFSRKESFVKALGFGLSLPLQDFEVGIGPSPTTQVSGRADAGSLSTWTTVSLNAGDRFAAALTAEGCGWWVEGLMLAPDCPTLQSKSLL
jgi:4'-phosphopantetheinyl transferase